MAERASRHYVVTGASGFIGSNLIRALCNRGDTVSAFVRNTDPDQNKLPASVRLYKWDSESTGGEWTKPLESCDGVIHLAGHPVLNQPFKSRWNTKNKALIRNTRINGTRNLINALRNAGNKPSVFICSSAVGYYGTYQTEAITESAPAGTDFLAQVCSEWEKEARVAETLGIRTVLLRTGIVLSMEGGALRKLIYPINSKISPFYLGFGGPLGNGDQWFPWIHIDDEIGAILFSLDNDNVTGPLNLAAPGILNNNDFTSILGKVLHRPTLFKIPTPILTVMFGEGHITLTEGQNVVPEQLRVFGYRFRYHNAEEALRNIFSNTN